MPTTTGNLNNVFDMSKPVKAEYMPEMMLKVSEGKSRQSVNNLLN